MKNILIKNSLGEMEIKTWAEKEYKRVMLIMKLIEETFLVDLNNYPELRKSILDTGNYIRRLPSMVSEIIISNKDIDN
jgi:hypothetical protein